MQFEVGKIYEGKVTGITKFGAFVELDKDTTGMVHISEIANTFVNEIKDHIQEGANVKVKVLSLGDDGKISLSIKKALPAPPPQARKPRAEGGFRQNNNSSNGGQNGGRGFNNNRAGGNSRDGGRPNGNGRSPFRPAYDKDRPPQDFTKNPPPVFNTRDSGGNSDFEDMLNKFKTTSEERFTDLKKVIDNKRKSPSRRK